MENVRETLMKKNPEINLNDRILERKFCYTTKRGNRIKLLQTRVKMRWMLCKLDYIAAKNVSDADDIIVVIEYAKGKRRAHCVQETTS